MSIFEEYGAFNSLPFLPKHLNKSIRLSGSVYDNSCEEDQGPAVQSIISLTSSLRVISLTILADSIHNILIFFAEKM